MPADFLNLNLEVLERRQPSLARHLRSLPEASALSVAPASSGEPTAQVSLPDGSERRLHSRRDPRREAVQWAEGFEVAPGSTTALMGVGLGYPVEEFLRRHKKDIGGLWCFESSPGVFRAMLSWKDWRWLLDEPRVSFFVAVDELAFRSQAAGCFQQVMVDGLAVLEYSPSVQLDADWYGARRQNVLDLVRQWTSEMLTVMERGRLFQTNTLTNFRTVPSSYLFRDVGEVLRGGPAILVSAGPSLNKNAGALAAAKGKIPIVSVDTSLRILLRQGITPDLVVSIDPLGLSRRHFEGVEGLERIPLAYDLEVAPEVSSGLPGPRLLVGNRKPLFYSWLEEAIGPLEGLTKGLTVAQAAYLLLSHYGADPILLVGQDLSFEREGGKTHADGAAFQGRFEPADSGKGKWEDPLNPKGLAEIPVLWVPANDGGQVPTTHTLFAYLKRFEEDIAASGSKTLNATEGGALIQGARPVVLADTIQELLAERPLEFPGFLSGHKQTALGENQGGALETLRMAMLEMLQEARRVCEDGFAKSEKLWRDLGWKTLSERDLQRRAREISDLYGWVSNNKKAQMLIDRAVMRSLYMLHKGDLPPMAERTPEHFRTVAERYRNFFGEALAMIETGERILS
jgi:hypothetical protein